ncbi:unnamed protein product [Adineta steineri]|uniref:G-protein coupled receptors family 1 profile domain-containing protein n=1 Tax=Adineta steineri TaxID=433720 RepID=A0A814FXX0_9BILA|nr:unnamed protein product [Adineta steineri]CAF0988729.1 unnamed protein product [Adineta steineri]
MYAHNLYDDLYGNVSFDNHWCYIRAYLLYVGLATLYHSHLLQPIFRFFRVVFYKSKQLQTIRFMFRLVLIQWLMDFLLILPVLFLHNFDYTPQYYYCQTLYIDIKKLLISTFIVYYIPMVGIGAIYFYILYYMKKTKNQSILQNRQVSNQRGLVVLHRINFLIGILFMVSFPAALTTLDLYQHQIGDVGAQHLAVGLRNNTTITTLDLQSNSICNTGVQHLADALKHNTKLTTLHLQYNQIGDVGAQHLSSALRNNMTLTTLNLRCNQIRNVGTQHLADALKNNTTLTTLDLQYNCIGDVGAKHLANALRYNTTLTTLHLVGNQIGDIGTQHLAHALRNNVALLTLTIEFNIIGDIGAQHLANALKYNTVILLLSYISVD